MNGLPLIIFSVFMFTTIVLILVVLILIARMKLVPKGKIKITINDNPKYTYQVPMGDKLLNVLCDQKIYLPSACGGGGTCGLCKVTIKEGGGHILPTETSLITRKEAREGVRLSCQVTVKDNMKLEIPTEIFDIKKWICKVRSNRNVATFIKELILELPEGEHVDLVLRGRVEGEAVLELGVVDDRLGRVHRGDGEVLLVAE